MGRVCVLRAPGGGWRGSWPVDWELLVVEDLARLAESWSSFSCFVVAPGEALQPQVREMLRLLERVGASAPVLLDPEANAPASGRQPSIPSGLSGEPGIHLRFSLRLEDPARSVREAVGRSLLHTFERHLREISAAPPDRGGSHLLDLAVSLLLAQKVPRMEEVDTAAESGTPVIFREVEDLASRLGCCVGHLGVEARQRGLRLGKLVRWTAVLLALSVLEEEGRRWTRVALRLGFGSQSGLTHLVKRTTGEPPKGLAREPWRVLLARALSAVTRAP